MFLHGTRMSPSDCSGSCGCCASAAQPNLYATCHNNFNLNWSLLPAVPSCVPVCPSFLGLASPWWSRLESGHSAATAAASSHPLDVQSTTDFTAYLLLYSEHTHWATPNTHFWILRLWFHLVNNTKKCCLLNKVVLCMSLLVKCILIIAENSPDNCFSVIHYRPVYRFSI